MDVSPLSFPHCMCVKPYYNGTWLYWTCCILTHCIVKPCQVLCTEVCWGDMETLPTLLALCEGNPPVMGFSGLPLQRASNVEFYVFVLLALHVVEQALELSVIWCLCDFTVMAVMGVSRHFGRILPTVVCQSMPPYADKWVSQQGSGANPDSRLNTHSLN